jgi:hypothetical protein
MEYFIPLRTYILATSEEEICFWVGCAVEEKCSLRVNVSLFQQSHLSVRVIVGDIT